MHLQKNFVVGLLALHFLNLAASLKTNDEFGIGLSFFDTNEANGKLSMVEREQLEEAKSLYKQDRLFSSYNIAQQLLKKLDDKSNFTDDDCVRLEAIDAKRALESSTFISDLTQQFDNLNAVLHELVDTDGWSLYREDAEGKTWTKEESNGRKLIRVEKTVSQSIFKLLAVFSEFDLYSSWFPFMTTSRELAQLTRSHRLAEFIFDLPWPLKSRKMVLDTFGIDWTEHNSILFHVKSIEQHPSVQLPPLEDPKSVRLNIIMGGFLLTVISPTVTAVSAVFDINDPYMNFVPSWAVNAILGKVVHQILLQMEKGAGFDDESEHSRRIGEKPGFYSASQEICNRLTQRTVNQSDSGRSACDALSDLQKIQS